jgi:hypothetical protein
MDKAGRTGIERLLPDHLAVLPLHQPFIFKWHFSLRNVYSWLALVHKCPMACRSPDTKFCYIRRFVPAPDRG